MIVTGGRTVSSSAQVNPGVIENSDIADDTILNAKINSAAAVAMSKLALAITNAEVAANAAIVDTKLAQIATASKVSGAAITLLTSLPAAAGVIPAANLPAAATTHRAGIGSKNRADASGTQVIAHGLGATPSTVILSYCFSVGTGLNVSIGSYDAGGNRYVASATGAKNASGTNAAIRLFYDNNDNDYQTGVVTVDGTNITITWTKTGSPTGVVNFMWEAVV